MASRPRPTTGSSGSSPGSSSWRPRSSSPRPGCGPRPSPRSSSCSRWPGCSSSSSTTCCRATRSGPAKFVLEGSVAITVATLLVALTGGAASPFFFAFPLIVGGAALVVSPSITVALAAAAALGYVLAVIAGPPAGSLGPDHRRRSSGSTSTALILLAYVAIVIAREQRRAARRGDPPVDGRLADRPVQPDLLLRGDRSRDRPQRPVGSRLLPADDGPRRAQGDQRPARPLPGRPRPARRRRGHRQGVRQIDTAARYGGDEFVVLLPETDPTGAFVLAEKIRIGVNDLGARAAGDRRRGRRCRSGSSATRTTAGRRTS